MFSKINNLLIRDKPPIAKLRKISQSKVIYQEKSLGHKKIVSNCLANTHRIYNYTVEIQYIMPSVLSLIKRLTGLYVMQILIYTKEYGKRTINSIMCEVLSLLLCKKVYGRGIVQRHAFLG